MEATRMVTPQMRHASLPLGRRCLRTVEGFLHSPQCGHICGSDSHTLHFVLCADRSVGCPLWHLYSRRACLSPRREFSALVTGSR